MCISFELILSLNHCVVQLNIKLNDVEGEFILDYFVLSTNVLSYSQLK